ncbi:1,6-anhydro-N-acetylmuramyl-L-alanine amidase AmpD [Dichelobacter nodosus]|uniref:1,6-anhydro-N-acetylmuramyl-L-alanine amidase AmpD n=1 Tax=Dichelobacter nodosus (strain VCS1703A) TaxID=246195 RepID=A5EXF1_DICNV|nr:1,6-anhydro-N-acetylmuramyl-L-alanine amidase AmpD [Dichelobacter nodosus]ABQ13568.1 N-acetylmuramoyl-L-alanine amidase [Dichelobacter nodosus VCS1703A]
MEKKSVMTIDESGRLTPARIINSPFFDERPNGCPIDTIVLHNISLPPRQFGTEAIDALFTGTLPAERHPFFAEIAHLRVCAHFLIDRRGAITQYVSTLKRAWHAGRSVFLGTENCNDFSVGIELNGCDDIPYTWQQYCACADLIDALMRRHPAISKERITTHQHIAPDRKTDPGAAFHYPTLMRLLARVQKSSS